MKTFEYRTVDKLSWPRGPWDSEPDKRQWQDEATGLPCLIVRSSLGSLCGYVGVPPNHPWYKQDYDAVDVSVHGGLTYASLCDEGAEDQSICHIPAPGEPDHVWWLGFDCAHGGDEIPLYGMPWMESPKYRDVGYVADQCRSLAQQIKAAQA